MSNKIDKPEGKLVSRVKIVTDVASLPQGLSVDMFVKLADSGFVFYDSNLGNRPKLYILDGATQEELPSFVDTKGQELDFENLKKQWEDDEYWRKELYKCRQSPLHYFTNYVSSSPKPTQEEIEDYLKSIGMTPSDDSGEVGVPKEDVVKAREQFAKSITLESLKELKPVRDKIDEEYQSETTKLLDEACLIFGLSQTDDGRKLVHSRVVAAIMKSDRRTAPPQLKHYITDKSGQWDKKMLNLTDVDVLVRLWKLIQ